MGFLDTLGLQYFYNQLKTKFPQTVNGKAVEDGNIEITTVPLAENLYSNDFIELTDEYIYRTSGGEKDIDSGEAILDKIEGNVDIVGRVESSVVAKPTTIPEELTFTIDDKTVWIGKASGAYNFTYIYPALPTSGEVSWEPGKENWICNTEVVSDLESQYGIVTNVEAPSITIIKNGNITSVSIVPSTWASKIKEPGEYQFSYNSDDQCWMMNGEPVDSLNDYGLTPQSSSYGPEDTFVVNYIIGTSSITNPIIINFDPGTRGTINLTKPLQFEATGFNQFNANSSNFYLSNATIADGSIVSGTGYVCFCKAVGGIKWGYMAYSNGGYILSSAGGAGYCSILPDFGVSVMQTRTEIDNESEMISSSTADRNTNTQSTIHFSNDGYVVVPVSNKSDLCIHTRWDGEDDAVYEAYTAPSVIALPTQGIIEENSNYSNLPLYNYGMPAVGEIRDVLNLTDKKYIKHIGRIEYSAQNLAQIMLMGVDFDYDSEFIYYVLADSDVITYSLDINEKYEVNDYGTEEFIMAEGFTTPVKATNIYGENLRNKLKNDTLTITQQKLNVSEIEQVMQNLGLALSSSW